MIGQFRSLFWATLWLVSCSSANAVATSSGGARARVTLVAPLKDLAATDCPTGRYADPNAKKIAGQVIRRLLIRYETRNVRGEVTEASGLLAWPARKNGSIRSGTVTRAVVYMHGTMIRPADAPSRGLGEGLQATCEFARAGYMVLMPDYLGLGDSQEYHPYMHAASMGPVAGDFIRASLATLREFSLRVPINWYLTGFSQGGHSVLALERYLEEKDDIVRFRRIVAISGPYDLDAVMLPALMHDPEPKSSAVVAAMTLYSYKKIYHDAWPEIDRVLQPRFESIITALAMKDAHAVHELAPENPRAMLIDSFRVALRDNADMPFRRHLRTNSFNDWTPKRPIHLLYSRDDRLVSPANAKAMATRWRARGATVIAQDFGPYGHGQGFLPGISLARRLFDRDGDALAVIARAKSKAQHDNRLKL